MGAEKKPPGIVNMGPDACLVRLGGDEFVLLVIDRSLAEARWLADEIRHAVARVDDLPAWTISLSVAAVEPGETDVSAAIERADRSLCRAKAQGRDRAAA
ncbi:diguanylate cyclase [Methylorubrum extorquens]